jgi:hypothetical protein
MGRVVAVRGGQVPVDVRVERVLRTVRELVHSLVGVGERAVGGFGNEVVAGPEVLVEAAVGQTGRAHDLGHAGALDPRLTDAGRGDLDDPLVRLGLLFAGLAH